MKKVLVTGAAGSIGIQVIKYLLSEDKYEITALDLKNRHNKKKLKKYQRRVNIVYGDINDQVLIDGLVRVQDFVINLATALPPFANIKKGLSEEIEINGTINIVRAIKKIKPSCHLFYASTTSMYKKSEHPSIKSTIVIDDNDYFSKSKLEAENIIKKELKNYTIYRIPLVLTDIINEPFIFTGNKKEMVHVITKEDAANAFVQGIENSKLINKKLYNIATDSINYGDLLNKILEIKGINLKYIFSRLFFDKNYSSHICKDSGELNNLINYQMDTLEDYYNRQIKNSKKRKIQIIMAKPFIRRK